MSHKQISVEELLELTKSHKNLMILDVRSSEEFEEGRMPNAYNLPLGQVSSDTVESALKERGLSRKDPVYVTCAVGPRAISACEKIEEDFDTVYHIVGCMNAWVEEGFPVEKD